MLDMKEVAGYVSINHGILSGVDFSSAGLEKMEPPFQGGDFLRGEWKRSTIMVLAVGEVIILVGVDNTDWSDVTGSTDEADAAALSACSLSVPGGGVSFVTFAIMN